MSKEVLPRLAGALVAAGFEDRENYQEGVPSYHTLYGRVTSGRLPQVRWLGNRWRWDTADLPAIAAALNLTRPPAA